MRVAFNFNVGLPTFVGPVFRHWRVESEGNQFCCSVQ